jgi:hypothetical protein
VAAKRVRPKRPAEPRDDRRASPEALRVLHEAEGGASGALAGAVVGAGAGPVGVVAGAIIGGVAGTLAGAALENARLSHEEHDKELDRVIGVDGGDIGDPKLRHPAAERGTYSAASSGAGAGSGGESAEGPISRPDD